MNQIPSLSQPKAATDTSGLPCLVMLARMHGIATDADQLLHEFGASDKNFGKTEILLAARHLGLQAKPIRFRSDRLLTLPLPAIGITAVGRCFILARAEADRVLIQDPAEGRPTVIEAAQLEAIGLNEIVLLASRASIAGEMRKFDFTWFIPALVKHRKLFGEVLAVSVAVQLVALVTPLFFQVVMDKVLVHRGFATLDVVAIGLLAVVLFEITLTGLRTYIFSHTTSRIDVELGAKLFRHLIALPISYFQARRVGDSVARVRELENIRAFLTGTSLTLLMDVAFSVVFVAVMLIYSGWLTLIVLLSLPCYAILSAALTPVLQSRLKEKFSRGAENQAFLVETIGAIDTVKSMSAEPQWTRKWDNQLAAYVSASFRTSVIGLATNSGVTLISKLVTVATLYFGAKLVIGGHLSVGQLIAFNMLAGNVAQPIMRLAQLWTDFQQTGISVQRLGDILNTRTELEGAKCNLPPIKGRIQLEDVHFRYRPDAAPVLKSVSLDIDAGEVIGMVGRSGSGKSTITRLVQRLFVPERGRVLIDGVDLALINASSLRRQVGVVLQDNVLFARSIRENIALTDPGAPLQSVVDAARLAGAHDFIVELPEGYETPVGEHGATLSGGQRQRIAIARALLTNPRILILDEATSALDYESERVIQNNMKAMSAGRTVIIIAHRLSAVRDANRIIVLDKGEIAESGTHAELLRREAGHYSRLHRLQHAAG